MYLNLVSSNNRESVSKKWSFLQKQAYFGNNNLYPTNQIMYLFSTRQIIHLRGNCFRKIFSKPQRVDD